VKIIFFNINDAKINPQGIEEFLETHKESTDIFCFQEAFDNAKEIFSKLLAEYKEASVYKYISDHDIFRLVTLTKPNMEFLKVDTVINDKNTLGPGLYTKIKVSNKILHLLNIHGVSRPGDKLDTPERIEQSQHILNYLSNIEGTKIIGGDFNLFPETSSIISLEKAGYKNLIKDYQIKCTRNEVAWRKYPDTKQYFSDYTFVSSNVAVRKFEAPYNEFSDHLPLVLEFDF
jgi:endonuclease/exonuclease/phosphatase family metal-dependent hydrolase